MGKQPSDWVEAISWQDRVKFLFEIKQTESQEFKTYLEIYGRDRIEKIWKEYVDDKSKLK